MLRTLLASFPESYFDNSDRVFRYYDEFGELSDIEFALNLVGSLLVIGLVILVLLCVVYCVFMGFGLMRMAHRKGISHGWMGFIPVLQLYTLGKVAATPQKPSRLEIPLIVLGCISMAFAVASLFYTVPLLSYAFEMGAREGYYADAAMRGLFEMIAVGTILGSISAGVSIALTVVMFVALHRVYKQFSPNSATVMTVFSILPLCILGIAIHPFMLFSIRNNPMWPPEHTLGFDDSASNI